MTRQQRRSKSQYLNAMRKAGYRPSKGYFYRNGRWKQRLAFRALLAVTGDGAVSLRQISGQELAGLLAEGGRP